MGFHVDHLPKSVGRRLKQYHRRKRLFSFARVVMGTLLVLGLLALVTMHIDRFAFLSWNTRMALVIGTFCASGTYGTVSLIRFFIRKPSPRQIAYELESKLPPEVEERFVSLEDILRHTDESVQDEVGEKLLDDLKNSAIAQSGGLAPASLVTDRKARNLFRGCLFLGIVYALFFLPQSYEFGLMGKRFLMPWRRDLPKPSFVKISVSPGSAIFFVEQPQEFHEPRAGEIKAKLQETLGRETQATFEDTSLKKMTGWFSQQMGDKVQVKLLNGESIEDRKVTLDAQGTVRELLSRLCRDMDLAWTGIGEKKVVVGAPARVWFSGKTNSRTSEKFRRELMERLSTNVALNLQDTPAPKAADLLAEQVDIDISFPSEGFETRTVNVQGRMRVQEALFRVAENTGTFWHVEQNVVRGKGSELVLQAESRGRMPAAVKWLVEKLGGSTTKCFIATRNLKEGEFHYGKAEKIEMSRVHRTLFLYSATDLQESFHYRVRYADAQTKIREVEVVKQPEVVDLELTLTPPEKYTTVEKKVLTRPEEGVAFLRGSKVGVSFKTDRPVAERRLEFEGRDEPIVLEAESHAKPVQHDFTLNEKVSCTINVVDSRGFENVDKPTITLIPREDEKPTVQLLYPSGKLRKVPGEIVPMKAVVRDDFGIAKVDIQYYLDPDRKSTAREIDVPLEKKQARELDITPVLDLGETGAAPGDVLLLRLQVKDSGDNYGTSRDIFVRVVPFTRGANERRRIAALQFFRDGLHLLATTKEAPGNGFEIAGDLYSKLQEMAKEHRVPLRDSASMRSLLELLEKEHHFTDQPRHKDDVRRIYGILYAACAASEATSESDGQKRRAALKKLAEEILPPLINYRQVKNLTWRFFGMKYEAENIGSKLEKLAALEKPPAQERKSVQRRAELYLTSLQDLGDELIRLSRRSESLAEEKISPTIGELNTAGYYLRMGSLKARSNSCAKVRALIPDLLVICQRAMPVLQKGETTARTKLRESFGASLSALSGGRRAWLQTDATMMHRNPFAPVWPQFLRFALSQSSGKKAELDRTLFARLFKSDSERSSLVRRESREALRMGFRIQAEDLLALENVSNIEKSLELQILRLEWADRQDKADETAARLRKKIQNLDFEADVPLAELRKLKKIFHPEKSGETTSPDKLMQQAREVYVLPGPSEQMATLLTSMDEVDSRLQKMAEGLKSGEAETIRRLLDDLVGVMNREKQLMDAVSRGLWLRLALFVPKWEKGRRQGKLMLKIRDIRERYDSRIGRSLAIVRQAVKGNSGRELERTRLRADIQKMVFMHKAIKGELKTIGDKFAAGKEIEKDPQKKYLLVEDFRRTREYVRVSEQLIGGTGGPKLARKFVREFPEAGLAHLSENVVLVSEAQQHLVEAREALQGDSPDRKKFANVLSSVRERIEKFQAVVDDSGSGDIQNRVENQLQELITRLQKLEPEGPEGKTDVKRALFELGEAVRHIKSVMREIRSIADRTRESGPQFQGGPAGIWDKQYQRDAEFARGRIERRSQRARALVTAGVLEALKEKPDPALYAQTRNWSLFLYRLIRGELAGVGGVEREQEEEDEEADPHLAFLHRELKKALQAEEIDYYQAVAREYLQSVQDYLEY